MSLQERKHRQNIQLQGQPGGSVRDAENDTCCKLYKGNIARYRELDSIINRKENHSRN